MWKCKSCSESHENSFDSCWKCGTGRDGTPPTEEVSTTFEEVSTTGATSIAPEGTINKVVKVVLKGGLLGLLSGDAHHTLSAAIAKENRDGWRVVQVIPDDSGNLFLIVVRFLLLLVTCLLYTTANGYWVIVERFPKQDK